MDVDTMITLDPPMEETIQLEKFPPSFDFNLENLFSCDHDQVQFPGFPPSLSSITENSSQILESSSSLQPSINKFEFENLDSFLLPNFSSQILESSSSLQPSINKFEFENLDSFLVPNFAKTSSLQLDQMENKNSNMTPTKEMIFQMAPLQPIQIDPESVKPPKRRNVKISKDPRSVAARHQRERVSERIRILKRLVPGAAKMDTASMLDEAYRYVTFLKNQVQYLEQVSATANNNNNMFRSNIGDEFTNGSLMSNNGISDYYYSLMNGCQQN